jgi:hypothetical protein
MWHPLHPQRTNYLTLISYKNSLLVTICKILPSTTQLFSTPPLSVPSNSPLGPISLLPLVQSSPIGKTCPEDVQWRLVPHPRDFPCHPEQMDRVVHRSGHIGELGGVRLQEEPVSWNGFEPPSLSVAKPLHRTFK